MSALKGGFVILVLAAGARLALAAPPQPPDASITASATVTKAKNAGGDKQTLRLDRYGDPLPPAAVARLGTVRFRHPFMVNELAYTPDGKMLASACSDATVRLWDAATGKPIRCFVREPNPIPDTGGVEIRRVAISPDGKLVLGMENDEAIRVWELASGKEVHKLIGGNGFAMALAPDGAMVAKAHGGGVSLFKPASGKKIRLLGAAARSVAALAFSPDGKYLAAGDAASIRMNDKDGAACSVRLWDSTSGKQLWELKRHSGSVAAVIFSPDGKTFVSASHDGTIRFWDPARGQMLRMLRPAEGNYPGQDGGPDWRRKGVHYGGVCALAFSPSGQVLASGGWDGVVRLWDPGTGKALHAWHAHGREVAGLAFAPDGKVLASSSWHHTIRLWDPATGKEVQPRQAHQAPVQAIAVSPDGRMAATACWDQSIHLWVLRTGELRHSLRGHTNSIYSVAFSPDAKAIASASADGSVRVWDVANGRELRKLMGHKGAVYGVAFSAVENTLLSGGDDHVRLWDCTSGKTLGEIRTTGYVSSMQASSDGRLIAFQGAHKLLWDLAARKERRRFDAFWVALAPDGRTCVTEGEDGIIHLWSVATGHELCSFPARGHGPGWVGAPRFLLSPDGRLLADLGAGAVNVWELSTGKLRRRFVGHEGTINAIAFSADGRAVLSGGADTTVLIWDLARRFETRPKELSPADLQALWRDLGGDDAERADRAIGALAAHPGQSVPFLGQHLKPATAGDPKRLAALISDLASDRFAVRERAAEELARWREQAEPALRQTLAKAPALETRRRIEQLLAKLRVPLAASELLRSVRAVEVLERIGTPDAHKLLMRLAAGPPHARVTDEATSALARMRALRP